MRVLIVEIGAGLVRAQVVALHPPQYSVARNSLHNKCPADADRFTYVQVLYISMKIGIFQNQRIGSYSRANFEIGYRRFNTIGYLSAWALSWRK